MSTHLPPLLTAIVLLFSAFPAAVGDGTYFHTGLQQHNISFRRDNDDRDATAIRL